MHHFHIAVSTRTLHFEVLTASRNSPSLSLGTAQHIFKLLRRMAWPTHRAKPPAPSTPGCHTLAHTRSTQPKSECQYQSANTRLQDRVEVSHRGIRSLDVNDPVPAKLASRRT